MTLTEPVGDTIKKKKKRFYRNLCTGKLFYFVDSRTNKVDAFDYDGNSITNRRTVFDLRAHGLEGFPDGIAVDRSGNLWVAIMGPGLVNFASKQPVISSCTIKNFFL